MVLDDGAVTEACLEHPELLSCQQQNSRNGKLSPSESSNSSKFKNNSTDLSDTNSNTNSTNSSNNDSCNYSLSTDSSSCSNEGSSASSAFPKTLPYRQLDSIFEPQLNSSNPNLTHLSNLSLPIKGITRSPNHSPKMCVKHNRNKTRPKSLRSDPMPFDLGNDRNTSSSCKNFDFAQCPVRSTNDTEEGFSTDQHSGIFNTNQGQEYLADDPKNFSYKPFSHCMLSASETEFLRRPQKPVHLNDGTYSASQSSASLAEGRHSRSSAGLVGGCRGFHRSEDARQDDQMRKTSPCTTCSAKVNLLLLGAKGVGKSALAVRFLTHRFIGEYHSAVTIVYRHALIVGSRERILEIVDSSTKTGEWRVPEPEITRADSVAVVYSVTDEDSFRLARSCLQRVRQLRQHTPPVALMANKLDLNHCRLITRNEGEMLAKEFGAHYAEVSAAESSSDIEPTFLYLVEQAAGSSGSRCHLKTTPSKSLLSFRNSLSPSAIRRFTKDKSDNYQSSLHGSSSTSTNWNCETPHCSSAEAEYSNARNSRSKRKGESICSSRCRSYDDSITYCKMEILDSEVPRSLSLAPKVSGTSRRKLTPAKKIRPYMPTGRSKRREKSSSITKSFASRMSVNDDAFFPPAKKCFSNLALPSSGSSRLTLIEDESVISREELNYPAQISRSVDQNLQKIEHQTDFVLPENNGKKYTTEEKPLTLLQRGRSFIQEAKDRHWKDNELRLSLRNIGSRSDVSRAEKSHSHITAPIPFPRSLNRSKKLPTEGKTWVCLDEDDEEKTKQLTDTQQVPVTSNGYLPTNEGKSRSAPVTAAIRDLDPSGAQQYLGSKPVGQSDRLRKFSVFNKTFSGFWTRNSMPDLPKATVNIYDKLDSFKKSLKKRSV